MINKLLKIFGSIFLTFFLFSGFAFASNLDSCYPYWVFNVNSSQPLYTNTPYTFTGHYDINLYKGINPCSYGGGGTFITSGINSLTYTFTTAGEYNLWNNSDGVGTTFTILDKPPPPVSQVFSFVSRSITNMSGNNLSAVLIPSITSLWPILLILLGIILTFYVLNKIIEIFKLFKK
jgi:hypothetical protein